MIGVGAEPQLAGAALKLPHAHRDLAGGAEVVGEHLEPGGRRFEHERGEVVARALPAHGHLRPAAHPHADAAEDHLAEQDIPWQWHAVGGRLGLGDEEAVALELADGLDAALLEEALVARGEPGVGGVLELAFLRSPDEPRVVLRAAGEPPPVRPRGLRGAGVGDLGLDGAEVLGVAGVVADADELVLHVVGEAAEGVALAAVPRAAVAADLAGLRHDLAGQHATRLARHGLEAVVHPGVGPLAEPPLHKLVVVVPDDGEADLGGAGVVGHIGIGLGPWADLLGLEHVGLEVAVALGVHLGPKVEVAGRLHAAFEPLGVAVVEWDHAGLAVGGLLGRVLDVPDAVRVAAREAARVPQSVAQECHRAPDLLVARSQDEEVPAVEHLHVVVPVPAELAVGPLAVVDPPVDDVGGAAHGLALGLRPQRRLGRAGDGDLDLAGVVEDAVVVGRGERVVGCHVAHVGQPSQLGHRLGPPALRVPSVCLGVDRVPGGEPAELARHVLLASIPQRGRVQDKRRACGHLCGLVEQRRRDQAAALADDGVGTVQRDLQRPLPADANIGGQQRAGALGLLGKLDAGERGPRGRELQVERHGGHRHIGVGHRPEKLDLRASGCRHGHTLPLGAEPAVGHLVEADLVEARPALVRVELQARRLDGGFERVADVLARRQGDLADATRHVRPIECKVCYTTQGHEYDGNSAGHGSPAHRAVGERAAGDLVDFGRLDEMLADGERLAQDELRQPRLPRRLDAEPRARVADEDAGELLGLLRHPHVLASGECGHLCGVERLGVEAGLVEPQVGLCLAAWDAAEAEARGREWLPVVAAPRREDLLAVVVDAHALQAVPHHGHVVPLIGLPLAEAGAVAEAVGLCLRVEDLEGEVALALDRDAEPDVEVALLLRADVGQAPEWGLRAEVAGRLHPEGEGALAWLDELRHVVAQRARAVLHTHGFAEPAGLEGHIARFSHRPERPVEGQMEHERVRCLRNGRTEHRGKGHGEDMVPGRHGASFPLPSPLATRPSPLPLAPTPQGQTGRRHTRSWRRWDCRRCRAGSRCGRGGGWTRSTRR